MELTEREKAYHKGYEQGRFDEYAERMGYEQAEKVKAKIDKQKNCPYCRKGKKKLIYEQDNSARAVRVRIKGQGKRGYRLIVNYRNKLEEDEYEPGGWIVKNTTERYGSDINFCPMCGRDLRGDN